MDGVANLGSFKLASAVDDSNDNGVDYDSLIKACCVLKEVAEQLIYKDFPPNDTPHENFKPVALSSSGVLDSSKIPPPSEQSWDDTDNSSMTPSNNACQSSVFTNDTTSSHYFNYSRNIGNEPLAELCVWTLRTLCSEILDMNPDLSSVVSSETLDSMSSCVRLLSELEGLNTDSKALNAPKRLCMFASEYARFFSTSALSPPAKLKNRSKRKSKSRYNNRKSDVALLSGSQGALLDISTTHATEIPTGYTVVATPSKLKQGLSVTLLLKREQSWEKAAQRPCVTALALIYPDRNEFVPPGFVIVKDAVSGVVTNFGTSGDRIVLCFRRSREGNPITDVKLLVPTLQELVPEGYTVIEKSPRNHIAALNDVANEPYSLFLAYRQRLESLEALRPSALFINANNHRDEANSRESYYYCTGGTVSKAFIGRFHVLDRSTHSLLSPSSVSNRLQLIGSSRNRDVSKDICQSEAGSDTGSCGEKEQSIELYLSYVQGQNNVNENYSCKVPVIPVSNIQIEDRLCQLYYQYNDKFCDEELIRKQMKALSFIPLASSVAKGDGINFAHVQSLRTILLLPILTACYTRHGGSALVSVEGLCNLIKNTNFFLDDVSTKEEVKLTRQRPGITLLDIAVQAVCDIATNGTQETNFCSCIEFIENAVKLSTGMLHPRTYGFVARAYFYIFYFGASIPKHDHTNTLSISNSIILSDERKKSLSYIDNISTSKIAALAFQKLILSVVHAAGKSTVSDLCGRTDDTHNVQHNSREQPLSGFLDSLLDSFNSTAVDSVELANFSQLALHQMYRSGGSELFWHEMMYVCGPGIFATCSTTSESGKELYCVVFSTLAIITKSAIGKSNLKGCEPLISREIDNKCLALELLLFFMESWSDEQEAITSMPRSSQMGRFSAPECLTYSVRRMATSCLLYNTNAIVQSLDVYKRMLRILSELWRSPVYRRKCKIELGLLIELLVLSVVDKQPIQSVSNDGLTCSNQVTYMDYQLELLSQLQNWFDSDPNELLEVFLNFESDFTSMEMEPTYDISSSVCGLFQKLIFNLSLLAERCNDILGFQIAATRKKLSSPNQSHPNNPKLVFCGKRAANSDFISEEYREKMRKVRKSSLVCMFSIQKALAIVGALLSPDARLFSLLSSWSDGSDIELNTYQHGLISSVQNASIEIEDNNSRSSEILKDDNKTTSHDLLNTASKICRKKSLKKAIEYLVACNYLDASPRNISAFVRLNSSLFDNSKVGEYLGEAGLEGTDTDYWRAIRYTYIRSSSFAGLSIDKALRFFLTECGFFLPGEAQKVDRILSTFSRCYYEDNAGDEALCPYKNEDSVLFLSFALIMLNTDLHKSHSNSKRSKHKKMTKSEFIQNIKGASDQGLDYNKELLSSMYDTIFNDPIKMTSNESESKGDGNQAQLESSENIRKADSIMRGIAVHESRPVQVADVPLATTISLIRNCVGRVWHYWYGVVNSGLEGAHLDPSSLEALVPILLYAQFTTIALGLTVESKAFSKQILRLKMFEEQREGNYYMKNDGNWCNDLEQLCTSNNVDDMISILRHVREFTQSIQSALLLDRLNREEMAKVLEKFEDADHLLQDPNRNLIRNGFLNKKSNRTGQTTTYQFYLFSDLLLYGKANARGSFVIHEELPLHLMKIIDWFPQSTRNRELIFQIVHPRKSFTVKCASHQERQVWMTDLRQALMLEVDHKVKTEAVRQVLL